MKSGEAWVNILIALTMAGLLVTIVFLFSQNRKLLNLAFKNPVSPTPAFISETPTMYLENETPSPTLPAILNSTATIVFESEQNIPANHKTQIQTRVVKPFLMYYTDQGGLDYIKTLTVSINTDANKATYPYLTKYVFGDGVNGGFVITIKDGQVSWWYPECMGPCPFSDNFKTKFPEVVKASGN